MSRNLLNTSGGAGSDQNLIPVGAMLSSKNNGVDPNTLNSNNFRPLVGFTGAVSLATNNLYANYNALQVKWMRSRGHAVMSANYTFGKAMGILNPTYDSFNLNNDYGVQSTNRPHIFNIAYSYNFGKVTKNKLVGGFANGWQVSGIVQAQSGANLMGQRGQNFGMNLNSAKIPGTTFNISNTAILGTPNILLTPILTCDPKSNLGPNQYLNPNCFAPPTAVGQNGSTILPVVYGPGYFNADLGVFKNFQMGESRRLQFRIDGYNFLNHPLWSFNGGSGLNLVFDPTTLSAANGKLSNSLFGTVTTKQGHRIVQLAAYFYF
jgi:hypothetical protein